MIESAMPVWVGTGAASAGMMAGIYFSFSGFIMQALNALGATAATDAMNSINRVILRSWFIMLFFGSTALFGFIAVMALLTPGLAGRWLLFFAGVTYVIGMFGCTAFLNVPLIYH